MCINIIYTFSNTGLAAGLSVLGVVLVVIAIAFIFFFYRKKVFSKFNKIHASMGKVQQSGTYIYIILYLYFMFLIILLGIDADEVIVHEQLGSGGHSDVFRATFRGTDVAVKVMNSHYFTTASSLSRFEFEVAIMCGLRHPNIILYIHNYFQILKMVLFDKLQLWDRM